jgi:hypothetical protein
MLARGTDFGANAFLLKTVPATLPTGFADTVRQWPLYMIVFVTPGRVPAEPERLPGQHPDRAGAGRHHHRRPAGLDHHRRGLAARNDRQHHAGPGR